MILDWLNPISKAFDVIGGIVNKRQDVSLEKYRVDGQVQISELENEVKAKTVLGNLLETLKDDKVIAWGRRLFIYPTGIHYALTLYDSCFRNVLPDWATWRTLELPANMQYIPYAVVGFLLLMVYKR